MQGLGFCQGHFSFTRSASRGHYRRLRGWNTEQGVCSFLFAPCFYQCHPGHSTWVIAVAVAIAGLVSSFLAIPEPFVSEIQAPVGQCPLLQSLVPSISIGSFLWTQTPATAGSITPPPPRRGWGLCSARPPPLHSVLIPVTSFLCLPPPLQIEAASCIPQWLVNLLKITLIKFFVSGFSPWQDPVCRHVKSMQMSGLFHNQMLIILSAVIRNRAF